MNLIYCLMSQKRNSLRRTIIVCFWLCGSLAPLFNPVACGAATPDSAISLRFEDAPIRVILQALADQRELNLVVADAVDGNLTIRLENVEWHQALNVILNLSQLEAELKDNVMLIMPQEERRLREQQRREDADLSEQKRPLSLLKIELQHVDAGELIETLTLQKGALLSDRAQIAADKRTNLLFIHDYPQKFAAINAFISEMDKPQQQIQITAQIVTMSDEGLKELGVKWGAGEESSSNPSLGFNDININLGLSSPTFQTGFNIAKLNGRLLSLELSALESENHVEIIASPRLLTANNQTAAIKQGTELPYEVSSGSNGATSIEFKSAVLGLEVTPRLLPNGKVNLTLFITQNTPGITIKQSNGGEVLAIDTQEIKTQVIVADNETLVLGGVFQQNQTSSIEKVPLLGDIPVLGRLFSRESNKQSKRELIIFITPKLIDI